jgi:hypothetical protein
MGIHWVSKEKNEKKDFKGGGGWGWDIDYQGGTW